MDEGYKTSPFPPLPWLQCHPTSQAHLCITRLSNALANLQVMSGALKALEYISRQLRSVPWRKWLIWRVECITLNAIEILLLSKPLPLQILPSTQIARNFSTLGRRENARTFGRAHFLLYPLLTVFPVSLHTQTPLSSPSPASFSAPPQQNYLSFSWIFRYIYYLLASCTAFLQKKMRRVGAQCNSTCLACRSPGFSPHPSQMVDDMKDLGLRSWRAVACLNRQ